MVIFMMPRNTRMNKIVTYAGQCKVFKMSVDGQTTYLFSNLSPYYTRGVFVTKKTSLSVCLHSFYYNKVVRLRRTGEVIQTIQSDRNDAPLYNNPRYVTTSFYLGRGDAGSEDWQISVQCMVCHTWKEQ